MSLLRFNWQNEASPHVLNVTKMPCFNAITKILERKQNTEKIDL